MWGNLGQRIIGHREQVFHAVQTHADDLYFSAMSEPKETEWISIEASGGPRDKEHWIRIDDFHIK